MKTVLVLLALVAFVMVVLVALRKRKSVQEVVNKNTQQVIVPETLAPSHTVAQEPNVAAVEEQVSGQVESRLEERQSETGIHHVFSEEIIPEDSTLRRHFLSNREAERLEITHPYPTDSMLRRHYENGMAWMLIPAVAVNINKGVETKSEEEENDVSPVQSEQKLTIPEDSTLRRHFLTQIQAEIEKLLSPRPTDSALKRHYDSLVKARIQAYLREEVL